MSDVSYMSKKCVVCKKIYQPTSNTQKYCVGCAAQVRKNQHNEQAKRRYLKKRLKDGLALMELQKDGQMVFPANEDAEEQTGGLIMEKGKSIELDDFIGRVNSCATGRWLVGYDEETSIKTQSLTATIRFNRARWDYIDSGNTHSKYLVLYSTDGGTENGRICIDNVCVAEYVRGNQYTNVYAISTDRGERYLFYLDSGRFTHNGRTRSLKEDDTTELSEIEAGC